MGELINKEHKDRLFVFLFGKEQNKAWTLALYNAVNGTDYDNPEDIEINTIEDVLYMGMKNDVSFLLSSFLSLYEHQSTYNPNMPVRNLMYLGRLYDGYIHSHKLNIYGPKQLNLPVPKCVTFYNGEEEHPDEILRLTNSFTEEGRNVSDVEVKVRMININPGYNDELVRACKPLHEYSWFIDEIRKNKKTMDINAAVDKALDGMPRDFVIWKYINMHKAEVMNMCLTEYNEAETMKMIKDAAREDGLEEGRKVGLAEGRAEGRADVNDKILKAINSGATLDDIRKMVSQQ